MPKKLTYKFNLNYLKNVDENIDIPASTKNYLALAKPFIAERFRFHKVTVSAVRSKSDAEMHDITFDADSRQEEIQTTSIVRSHISTLLKRASEWIVYKTPPDSTQV